MDEILYESVRRSRLRKLQNSIKSLSGLVAYYPLDEVSGSTAFNKAPSTKGTLDGAISGATLGQPGKSGRAYSFDGINDVVSTGLWKSTSVSSTMFALFKSSNFAQNAQSIISNGDGTGGSGRGQGIVLSGNATTDGSLMILDHVIAWRDTGVKIANNNWHSVALILNASGNPTVVLDGVSIFSSGSITFDIPNTGSYIGADTTGGQHPFKGLIQHGFFCNRAMNVSEILALTRIAGLT